MELLTILASFSQVTFTLASGLVGVFLFLLMILTGWTERARQPRRARFLMIGGTGLIIVWLWTRIAITIGESIGW